MAPEDLIVQLNSRALIRSSAILSNDVCNSEILNLRNAMALHLRIELV